MFIIRKSLLDLYKEDDKGYIIYSNSKIAIVRKYGHYYKHNFKEIYESFEYLLIGIGNLLIFPIALFDALIGFIPRIQFIDYRQDNIKNRAEEQASKELEELLKSED